MSPPSRELKELDQSIKAAHTKTDLFVRERFVQQEAKRLGLTSDDYRKLFAIRKKDSDILPDAPAGLPSKAMWFYQDLSRWQRLLLVWNGGKWLLGGLPNLTILFVGVRFLMEIPRREKEAKYQAWQVVHTAYGQRVSGARIAALEDLNDQGEFLGGLTLEDEANLSDIRLRGAKLRDAKLFRADLRGAYLEGADLRGAYLEGADLRGANLTNSTLESTVLTSAILLSTDLSTAKGLTEEQLGEDNLLFLCHVKLPEGSKVNPQRDCEKLPAVLLKLYPEEFKDLASAKAHIDKAPQP